MDNGLFELSIKVDGADSLKKFNPQLVTQFMASQAEYVKNVWAAAVMGQQLPGMTKAVNDPKYAQSIKVKSIAEGNYQVVADYEGASRIEQGYASFDMKPGMLSSASARPTADGTGRYITVPFRQYTQASGGGIRPSASAENTMPADVHLYTKLFGRFSGTEEWKTKLMNGAMTAPYTWQTGKLDGLTKTQTSGGANRYFTFRRISTTRRIDLGDGRSIVVGSDSNSWIHPGQMANPIMASVEALVRPVIIQELQGFIKAMSEH